MRQQAQRDLTAFLNALTELATPPSDASAKLKELSDRSGLDGGQLRASYLGALRNYLERTLEDDLVTTAEEEHMNGLASLLGIDQEAFDAEFEDMIPRLFVARANDGRLPSLPSERIMLKKSEVVHLETNAELMKEVMEREWRGGYRGFSFRIARGVRFHTGGVRGKSVVVGTRLETADTGILTVTSKRAVYTGSRKTIEMPYAKLISLNVFDDGMRFHLSNRKNPPLFRLQSGVPAAIAAAMNTASQDPNE